MTERLTRLEMQTTPETRYEVRAPLVRVCAARKPPFVVGGHPMPRVLAYSPHSADVA